MAEIEDLSHSFPNFYVMNGGQGFGIYGVYLVSGFTSWTEVGWDGIPFFGEDSDTASVKPFITFITGEAESGQKTRYLIFCKVLTRRNWRNWHVLRVHIRLSTQTHRRPGSVCLGWKRFTFWAQESLVLLPNRDANTVDMIPA